MAFTYEYARPALTVDVVVFAPGARGGLRVLLIRRRRAPFRGRWALPGGFVDADEDLDEAARRELREETGLQVGPLQQLGAYGTPGRDPRGHTVSVVFVAGAPAAALATAGDDASDCVWHPAGKPPPLAFDHAVVLRDARRRLRTLAVDEVALRRALFTPRQRAAAAALRAVALGGRRK